MRLLAQAQIDVDAAACRLPCQAAGELLIAVAVDAAAWLQARRQSTVGELREQPVAAAAVLGAVDLQPVQFAGVGSAPAPSEPAQAEPRASRIPPIGGGVSAPTGTAPSAAATPVHQPSFEPAAFLRVAKTSFIRLQAANDAKDLDDIRDFTTPELYAALAMQIAERGDEPQRTEVVSVDASLAETAMEDGFEIASVRFTGLIRETPGAQPEAFDEIWHVRRKASDPKAAWLIMGIQQVG